MREEEQVLPTVPSRELALAMTDMDAVEIATTVIYVLWSLQ